MARIFYSVMGEGRGHATRARAIIEGLRVEHEVSVFTHGHAYDLLQPVFDDTNVELRSIPGLGWEYGGSKRVDYARTLMRGLRFLLRLPRHRTQLEKLIEREQPDLVVTDFEPLLPRAALRCGVPFLSLNHQHFLVVNDFSHLPGWLRRRAAAMVPFVKAFYSGQLQTIVSSFFAGRLLPGCDDVLQIGVLLRPELLAARPEHGSHLVAYIRRFATPRVMQSLKACGREVRVYGMGEQPADGNLVFRPISERGFIEDLATCEALVSTAGNQLVGEALFLGKPVFAMPEPDNFEQYINAHYLAGLGTGEWSEMQHVSPGRVKSFLGRVDELRGRIVRARFNGNIPALKAIRRQLGRIHNNRVVTA